MTDQLIRCGWVNTNPLYIAYHDEEWGTPCHDDRRLFEFLILEGVQAGLSWETVLNKRANYHRAFDDFDPAKVAEYGPDDVARLLADPGIVRNRAKIAAAINNARHFLEVQKEFGSFDRYIWQFVDNRPIVGNYPTLKDVPIYTPQAEAMSRDLKKRGFSFVGPTICYSFMQAMGLVDDHVADCWRRGQGSDVR